MALANDNETQPFLPFTRVHANSSDSPLEFEPIWISLSLISIIIFTVGGNSLVCIAVLRERHLQNTTNYFLTSLAITDCLVACLVMPIAVAVEFIGYFPFDPLTCNIWLTFDVCCSTASIWHMSVMSLNRYQTLRYPLKYGRNKRRSLVTYKIITIWLISFAICLPLFILGLIDSSNVYNETTRLCFAAHRTFKIYGSVVAFFIPLIIMIITYALTMAALQQAHTTKRQRTKRQRKIRAVVNLAAMAIKWKRAVNTVEIPDEKQSSTKPEHRSLSEEQQIPVNDARKRASSLLENVPPKKSIFISSQHLNEHSQSGAATQRRLPRGKQLESFPEKPPEQPSTQNLYLSTPNNLQAPTRRSHSFVPLLDVNHGRKNRRRSSSVHTLLQIRRNSAKISEELANLSAQLSASASSAGLGSKRASLSVPTDYEPPERDTPTIAQLLAETSVNQPILLSTSLLAVNPKRRRRSNSADIRLPIFEFNGEKTSMPTPTIPNLLITRDSTQHSPPRSQEPPTPASTVDGACQKIKDWITTTASSSTTARHASHSKSPPRWISAANISENTPILTGDKQQLPPLTHLKKHFPRIEQLYGQTSTPNSTFQPSQQNQQHLLLDDHVASVQSFVSVQRSSVYSLTSSILASRLSRVQRVSTSSSIGSSSHQGTVRRSRPRLNEIVSQVSFQMVSLDTDDTSSCTSSLTYHSTQLPPALTGTANATSQQQRKKRQRFKTTVKKSATNERKAMRVLLIIFVIFVILWTPFFVITLVSCFVEDIHPLFMSGATWLGYASSCANPIIYTIFSRTFRQTFFNILTCRKTVHTRPSSIMFNPSAQSKTMSVGRKFSALSRGHVDVR